MPWKVLNFHFNHTFPLSFSLSNTPIMTWLQIEATDMIRIITLTDFMIVEIVVIVDMVDIMEVLATTIIAIIVHMMKLTGNILQIVQFCD